MSFTKLPVALVGAAATVAVLAPAVSAAQINDLCTINKDAYLVYTYPSGATAGVVAKAGSWVRITGYYSTTYTVRYQGAVGNIERSTVNQNTCTQ